MNYQQTLDNEPHWAPSVNHVCHRHSSFAKEWLLHQGSLTKKLRRHARDSFRVMLLSQSIQRARFSEQRALNLSNRNNALIREVALWVDGTAWVYARTVIPLSTLKGKLRRLQHLGNRPLGEQLFANTTMRREPMMFAPIENTHLPTTLKGSQPLGGRRTLFRLNNKPLLVCEVFLEAINNQNKKLDHS